MKLRINSISLAILAGLWLASPAIAEEPNYLGRGDYIDLAAGDANRANRAIQHPTPWPSYVNNTHIHTPSQQGISALEKMFKRYSGSSSSAPTTVINVGSQ